MERETTTHQPDDDRGTSPPDRGLRIFDLALGIVGIVLAIVTGFAVVLGAIVVSGNGTVSLDTTLPAPYSVVLPGDAPVDGATGEPDIAALPRVDVAADGSLTSVNFDRDEDPPFDEAPAIATTFVVDDDDRATRLLLVGLITAWITLAWVALVNLRGLVRDARDGQPFHARNAKRLRTLAATAFAYPAATAAGIALVRRTSDVDQTTGFGLAPGWIPAILAGFGLLALAEVFRRGHQLQELEAGTV